MLIVSVSGRIAALDGLLHRLAAAIIAFPASDESITGAHNIYAAPASLL
jgi:hypothetical protein